MFTKNVLPAVLCALALAGSAAAESDSGCTAASIEEAMGVAGLQETYELFQDRNVIDAIEAATSGLTILAPDFSFDSGANDYDEQFTISQVDGVLEDGEYTNVLLRGLITKQFTFQDFTDMAPFGSPASDDSLEFVILSTLDLDVTLWTPTSGSGNIFFRSIFDDEGFTRTGIVSLVTPEAIDICSGQHTMFRITGPLLTNQEAGFIRGVLGIPESP